MHGKYVLGAGATGLAAAYSSGWPVLEQMIGKGGLCATYCKAGYRFEPGGGHWLFGVSPAMHRFLSRFGKLRRHSRKASVYFSAEDRYVPYPVQDSLEVFSPPHAPEQKKTFKGWLECTFGLDACSEFFWPFNECYTDGLFTSIAPQDTYKTVGCVYNDLFYYPDYGLKHMFALMSVGREVRYGLRVWLIKDGWIHFEDGSTIGYDTIISTIPLVRLAEMCGIETTPDPHTSVMVLNIGGTPGPGLPEVHWVYVVGAPFYRVGIYSNVSEQFAPEGKVALYVEQAFYDREPYRCYPRRAVTWLYEHDYLKTIDIVDESWVDVAYTWHWPGWTWRQDTLAALSDRNIYSIGRYGGWRFQGIAQSIENGLYVGAML